MTVTHVRVHTQIGFANPFLRCDTCKESVRYWHDPERCGSRCGKDACNYPCEHKLGVTSTCYSWSPVDGCSCEEPCK
jgi:hypothetical protein